MSQSLYHLSDREWTQIRACITFWLEVVEVSKKHPCSHPRVAKMFKQYAPLTQAELERLLESVPESLFITAKEAAEQFAVKPDKMRLLIEQYGVPAEFSKGMMRVYRAELVQEAVERYRRGEAPN